MLPTADDHTPFFLNASHWFSKIIGSQLYFSPNATLLNKINHLPNEQFWRNYYLPFACLIIDKSHHSITMVRDHFGLEPFFYFYAEQQFIFASTIGDLITALGNTPKLSTKQVEQLLINCCTRQDKYTDETLYEGIYRVEPGSCVSIKAHKRSKTYYWHLAEQVVPTNYKNPSDYLEHFSALLHEGLSLYTANHTQIACEFSGGVDSTTVLLGLKKLNIKPALYLHASPKDLNNQLPHDIVDALSMGPLKKIGAEHFNLQTVIQEISYLFAGAPNYFFTIGANNIHQAVKRDGHTLLLSGFGGDECVSNHTPLSIYLCECFLKNKHWQAWQEIRSSEAHKKTLPAYQLLQFLKRYYTAYTQKNTSKSNTIRNFEYKLLQGIRSQHIRLRIEESAVIAKHYGFEYRYPLLYPKLVEFCFALPIELKRNQGLTRLMPRRYLTQSLSEEILNRQKKDGSIMPATLAHIQHAFQEGIYKEQFCQLPYIELARKIATQFRGNENSSLIQEVLLYAIKHYQVKTTRTT
ncbi:MAG: asparagine synthase-related protein [Gammaproteobacteria bacterium]|nr:asparagine synthase-related protein [Gammaproteobacteria bacterium]